MKVLLVVALIISAPVCAVSGAEELSLLKEDFEGDLSMWSLDNGDSIEIIADPGSSENHVLQLTPEKETFTHAIYRDSEGWSDIRIEGRFLFPTEGDGYLGFIYNYEESQETAEISRMDFGCIYVKSNGSYVRVSPHHDGNPSWRLWEEYRVDLEGERQIQVESWYDFRLDVRADSAELYIQDMSAPVVRFDQAPNRSGAIGLEARPGGGEPVWVDDLVVTKLEPSTEVATNPPSESADDLSADSSADQTSSREWEILGPFSDSEDLGLDPPELLVEGWQQVNTDSRDMLVTGRVTQYRSGDHSVAYLRTRFNVTDSENGPTWLAASSANRLDVWLNGYFRGTVAAERFIWSDYRTSYENPGARLPLSPKVGENEIIIRVHGRRFAGGGLFVDLVRP